MFDLEYFFNNFFKLPPLANKKEMVEVYIDMAVHTRKLLPKDLLLKRRPNEEEQIYCYRLENYEPITYGSMNKALDELFRIVNGINFKLNIPDSIKEYIAGPNFGGYSLVLYLQKIILKRMIEDPNGLLVWIPTGEGLTNSSAKALPQPYIVCSENITYMDENVCAFLSDEKSPVIVNKKEEFSGEVYWIFTADAFYKLIQKGKKSEKNFVVELIYEHNIGEIPVIKLGGDMTAYGYYESFFAPYLAYGNEAIRQFSDWQAIMITSSFPYIEEFAISCDIEEPKNRSSNPVILGEEEFSGEERPYERQKQLKVIPKTPYGVTLRQVPSKSDTWDAVLDPSIPSRRFIHPDIGIAKYSGEAWQLLIEKAEDSLHLNLGEGLLSGKAKLIDKTGQDSMISKIGNNFFDNIFLKSLQFVDGFYNYHPIDKAISIDKPNTFEIKTEGDLVAEIALLKEKNVPSFFLQEATRDLSKKRFSGNKLSQKIFDVISILDPLYVYDIQEKQSMVAGNNISKEAYVKSLYIYSLLLKIAYDKTPDVFITMDLNAISTILDQELQSYYQAISATIPLI